MKSKRKIIRIDEEQCDGCGVCVPSCAEGAIQIVDGKAKLVAEKYCDGLGACLGECPKDALQIVEVEAEAFDPSADSRRAKFRMTSTAGEHVGSSISAHPHEDAKMACGCPSTLIQSFAPRKSCQEPNEPVSQLPGFSELTHWPIQIRLVPPTARFLRGADLLVAADCTPVAYPHFHQDFLKGKVVLLGCPKFDDAEEYVEKFAEIFAANDIRSVTVVVMEVPCCQGLPRIVKEGMALAEKAVPLETVVISARGERIGSL
jgi:Pyruvate/2-oxoacid:ferredoxin oxidoreductase delta subunit